MRKITISKMEKLSDEQQEQLKESMVNGKFIGVEFNNGINWTKVEDISTGEELWISEDLETEVERNFFQQMKQKLYMIHTNYFLDTFKSVTDRFYMSKYLNNFMIK